MSPLDNLDRGAAADQPPAGPYNKDKFWFSNDTGELSVSDGTAWTVINGGGGGGAAGFGDEITFGDLVPTVTANNGFALLKNGGGNYSFSVANPLAVDAWVTGAVVFTELFIETGAYSGPIHYRQQANVQGGDLPLGSALVTAGTVEAGKTGPLPPNGQVFIPAMIRPFGIEIAAGVTKTLDLLHAMFLADDGSAGTYPVGFNGLPRLIYTGVAI